MHAGQNLISSSLLTGATSDAAIKACSLNLTQASALTKCLERDAAGYLYSSAVSVGDAILGINELLLTWATVKLYYATFYAIRALLALNGTCFFFANRYYFVIDAAAGRTPVKKQKSTHKTVIKEFQQRKTEPYLLSQQIGFDDPLDWLMAKREEANYGKPKFQEPGIPDHFRMIVKFGVRASVRQYLADKSGIYLFDPDHAILAYPLSVFRKAYDKFASLGGQSFTKDESRYVAQLFRDSKGPLPEAHDLFNIR